MTTFGAVFVVKRSLAGENTRYCPVPAYHKDRRQIVNDYGMRYPPPPPLALHDHLTTSGRGGGGGTK